MSVAKDLPNFDTHMEDTETDQQALDRFHEEELGVSRHVTGSTFRACEVRPGEAEIVYPLAALLRAPAPGAELDSTGRRRLRCSSFRSITTRTATAWRRSGFMSHSDPAGWQLGLERVATAQGGRALRPVNEEHAEFQAPLLREALRTSLTTLWP